MGPGPLCIAGGGEFARPCDPLDALLAAAAPPGPVVIVPSAAGQGREYETAGRNGLRHHRRVSPDREVSVATDPREDADRARAQIDAAAVVVLPGGSPGRLLDALTGPLVGAVEAAVGRGAAVSGASAGAMVLCAVVMLPGNGTTAPGLGLLPGAVLPHYPSSRAWRDALAGRTPLWGLPECGGVVVDGGEARAAGAAGVTIVSADGETALAPGSTWALPDPS